MFVEETVNYVPHGIYATQPDRDGKFPWTFGWVHTRQEGREIRTEVAELDSKQLKEKLKYLQGHGDPGSERQRLVPLKPLDTWSAVVTAVNRNGTVDLAVTVGTRSGVTLNMRGIPMVESKKAQQLMTAQRVHGGRHPAADLAHTCHSAGYQQEGDE